MQNIQDYGEGVRVLDITSDHKYALNEDALKDILLHEDIKDCPVSVISVAGAFRTGKSFLLDFFLKYLYTKPERRADITWLSDNGQMLKGFDWRSGSEAHTRGVLMWSKPIKLTLADGKTVAVVLLDTQGTFDSESTVKDCSTIFALSTLLSSVQIYNLKDNIKANDLQHLQLFTEYGRMASTEAGTPFQNLMFLIRDWVYINEHPYGSTGGKQFLEKRLKIDAGLVEEQQVVRRHIMSSFEKVECFLMPHPGETVTTDPQFKGAIEDIPAKFLNSLHEFVKLIFDPKKLSPKTIQGNPLTAKDLLFYFKTYTNEFNSSKLPTLNTILKANEEASMLSACDAARSSYQKSMDVVCGPDQPSTTTSALEEIHRAAVVVAVETFKSKRFGNHQQTEQVLTNITADFESSLAVYHLMNDGKVQRAMSDATKMYTSLMLNDVSPDDMCQHPKDLKDSHEKAKVDVLVMFDSRHRTSEVENDNRVELIKVMDDQYSQLCSVNKANNMSAVTEAREDYSSFMDNLCGNPLCMGQRELENNHENAKERAFEIFDARRNQPSTHEEDIYKSYLSKDLEESFGKIHAQNETNNKAAVTAAMDCYKNDIGLICNVHLPCLHPDDLAIESRESMSRALREFHSRRKWGSDVDNNDRHYVDLERLLNCYYEEINQMNERNNRLLVERTFKEYCEAMDAICSEGKPQLEPEHLNTVNTNATKMALERFKERRRQTEHELPLDNHHAQLIQDMNNRIGLYRIINENNRGPSMSDDALLMLLSSTMMTSVGGPIASIAAVASSLLSRFLRH